MFRRCLTVALVLAVADVAAAQEPPKPIRLILQPPKASPRKLQYPLLVPVSAQRPGNAITDYKDANSKHRKLIKDEGFQGYEAKIGPWRELPLSDLPRKEMAEFFKQYEEVFAAMEAGAHREYADWEHLDGLRKKGIGALLGEDIQRVRGLIDLLSLRIRFDLAEGKIDQALKDLQTGYTIARHTAQSPTLIGSLVGNALTGVMNERLDEVLRQPNVPSLYWSLGDMPTTLSTFQRPMQGDRLSAWATFPGLLESATDLNAGPMTAEQVQQSVKMLGSLQDDPVSQALAVAFQVRMGLAIEQKHEAAKKALIESGRPKDKVEAMPHFQVALLHSFLQYDRILDEMQAAQQLPPWEALPKLGAFNKKKAQDWQKEADAPAIPLMALLLPAMQKVYRAHLRTDRRLAALRVVEALRLYAAAHDGKFPAVLKDIKDVPVPIDPGTGKEFGYRVKDDQATLTGPPLGSETNTNPFAFTYELTFKR